MNEHERYRQAFAALDNRVTPAQIRALAEAGKGEHKMKRNKTLRVALIAALIVLLLTGTVTAVGIRGGWLLPLLSNAGVDPELLEKAASPAVSVTVGNERWTVDELLSEGRIVLFQYTRESLDGSPLPEMPEGVRWQLYLMDEDDILLNDNQGSTNYPTADSGEPTRRVELESHEIYCNGREPDWEHVTLLLYLEGASPLPRLVYTAPAGTPRSRVASLENGTPVRIGRFTLELDPSSVTRDADASFAAVLNDGTEVEGRGGSGVASPETGFEPGYTVQITLSQIIEPDDVAAIEIGGVQYPIS